MRLETNREIDKEKWDSMVASFCGSIFHMSVWEKFITIRQPNSTPLFFTLLDDTGSVIGCALGFKDCSKNRLKSYLRCHLWFDSMPLVLASDNSIECTFLNMIQEYALRHGYTSISIGSFASKDLGDCLTSLNYSKKERLEFIVPLECPEETNYAGLSKLRRDNIKRASNKGLKCVELSNSKSAEQLCRINEIITSRVGDKTGLPKSSHSPCVLNQYKVLLESKYTKAWAAVLDEEVVSIALFGFTNHMAVYISGGSDQKGLKLQASSFLLWSSLQNFRLLGVKNLSLGGCSISATSEDNNEHGVYLFKKSFGGKILKCTSGEKILEKYRYELDRRLKIINHKIKDYLYI